MARQRISGTELARLLHASPQPVYALDEDRKLVFLNDACQQWLAMPADDLLGGTCCYHSEPLSGAEAALSGLAPPPSAWIERISLGIVAARGAAGAVHFRRAHFLLLGEGADEPAGVLAVVESVEAERAGAENTPGEAAGFAAARGGAAENSLPPTPESEAQRLHRQLWSFRQRRVGQLRGTRLVGNTPAVQLAQRRVEAAVAQPVNVLIVGPRGSGRQRIAEAIHFASADPAGVLVPLDCAALPGDLVLSTVAALVANSPTTGGTSAATAPSTLLLNHAEELDADVQSALFDVLFARPTSIRRMATARASLLSLAAAQQFHARLAAELSTIVIDLPPLAERRADLPLVAQLLVEEINASVEKQLAGFSEEALDRLDAYHWPGDVDELATITAEAHRAAAGPEIQCADLPEKLRLAAFAAAHPPKAEERIVLDEFLGELQRELIRRALARAKGNKAKAARLLGLTRPRLYRRMMQLGLDP